MKAPKTKSTNLHLQHQLDSQGQGKDDGQDFFSKSPSESTPFFSPSTIQPKLTIGQPNDKYEKEADAMADRIVSGDTNTSTFASGNTNIQRTCADCEKEIQRMSQPIIQRMAEEEEVQPKLMRKSANGGGVATAALSSQLNSSKGGGSPMSASTNQQMSQAYGTDFSQVRVHTGSSAVQMNQGLNARAFTHGSDVYFNSGEYNLGSKEGKRLLGHELTHVVQQGGGDRKMIQPKLVYAGGFSGFKQGCAEIKKSKDGIWTPATRDFKANASRGGGKSIRDLSGFLNYIKGQNKGAIKKLGIIGHSDGDAFGFSGNTEQDGDVSFSQYINEDELDNNKKTIAGLRDRFAKDAEITLYSCNSGSVSGTLMAAMSTAFGVCVKGFKRYVMWCIEWKNKTCRIISRGNVFYNNIRPGDPMPDLDYKPDCKDANKTVTQLVPDTKNCSGVITPPPQKPDKSLNYF